MSYVTIMVFFQQFILTQKMSYIIQKCKMTHSSFLKYEVPEISEIYKETYMNCSGPLQQSITNLVA